MSNVTPLRTHEGPWLSLRDICVSYKGHQVVHDVSLDVAQGEVVAIVGPSGAGKSSLLRSVNHLETPSSGEIVLAGERVTPKNLLAHRRHVGMVFQSFNLFPHLNAREIVALAQVHSLGRGTPTVIITGRNQRPVGDTVRAVLGVRGEPGRPAEPENGLVWRALADHVDSPGYEDEWVTVTDLDRATLATHPWSLTGGGASELAQGIDSARTRTLDDVMLEIGRTTHTGNDEAFFVPSDSVATLGLGTSTVPVVLGTEVRDYTITPEHATLFPYDDEGEAVEPEPVLLRHLWRVRRSLETQLDFQQTKVERGLRWFDHSMFFAKRYRAPLSISFAFVATHNHFVLDRGGKVFNRSAPVIKLPEGAREEDHLGLLGVLNSSTACFWLKQNSHIKGRPGAESGGADEPWEHRFEFTGTTLQDFPLSAVLPLERGRTLDRLAQKAASQAPAAVAAEDTPTASALANASSAYSHPVVGWSRSRRSWTGRCTGCTGWSRTT